MELGSVCWAYLLVFVFSGEGQGSYVLPVAFLSSSGKESAPWELEGRTELPSCLPPLPQPSAATCLHKPNAAAGLQPPLPSSPPQPMPYALSRNQHAFSCPLLTPPLKKTPLPPGRERQIWCQSLTATTAVSAIAIGESQGYISPAHGTSQAFSSEMANWWPTGWVQMLKDFVWS